MKSILFVILTFFSAGAVAQEPGVLADSSRALFEVPIAAFVPDLSGLEGVLNVQVTSSEAPQTQAGRTRIEWRSRTVTWGGVPLGELSATWEREAEGPARLDVTFTGAMLGFTATLEGGIEVDLVAGKVSFSPGPLSGTVRVQMPDLAPLGAWLGMELGGAATLEMTLGGLAEEPKIEGVLTVENFEIQSHPMGRILVGFDHDVTSQILWKVGDDTQGMSGEARLPFELDLVEGTWKLSRELALNVKGRFDQLDVKLGRRFLEIPGMFSGKMSGTFAAEGALNELLAELSVAGPLRVGKHEEPFEFVWRSRVDGQDFKGRWGTGVSVTGDVVLPVLTWFEGKEDVGNSAVRGVLSVNLPLTTLEGVFAKLRDARGSVLGEVALAGTLAKPVLSGKLETRDGAATLRALHRRVENFVGVVNFGGSGWTWNAQGRVAPGVFEASGSGYILRQPEADQSASWKVGVVGEFSARKFPWIQRDFPIGKIDGTGSFDVQMTSERKDVALKLARVDVQLLDEELPKSEAIPSNPDVVFIEEAGERDSGHSGQFGLQVEAPDGIHVAGRGVDLTVQGSMGMSRVGDVVKVEGGFDVEKGGTMSLFDYSFGLLSGRVTLAPGNLRRPAQLREDGAFEPMAMEPVIAMSAESDVEGTFVLVRLDGALQRPTLTLASLPAVPEYQIMTLLVTGRLDAVDDRDGNVRKAVAKLVERYHNPSLQRQLFDQLGIDKVGVGFGSSVTEPILTVGKQINKTLYAETVYRHGADTDVNLMEGRIEKRIARNWTVDSTFGEAAEGRVGVFWKQRFGGPVPEPPSPDAWARYLPPPPGDADRDGVLDPWDVCVAGIEDQDGFEDEDGCADVDNDGDGVLDTADATPNAAETVNGFEDEDGAPDVVPNRLLGFRAEVLPILFTRNSAVVARESLPRLRSVGRLISMLGEGLTIEIGGHSDEQGTVRTKERVSQSRGRAVRDALVRAGVDPALIEVVSYSDSVPVDTSGTPEGADRNRRAEIKILAETPNPPAENSTP